MIKFSCFYQILKKICDHPLLLTKRAAEDVLEGMDSVLNPQDHSVAEKLAMHIADVAEKFDIVDKHDISCKISFILSLLVRMHSDNSYSLLILIAHVSYFLLPCRMI